MSSNIELIEEIKVSNILGESVTWDWRVQSIWWLDIMGYKIYQYAWREKVLSVYETPERACAIALTMKSDQLVVAFETGIAIYQPYSNSSGKAGIIRWIYRPFYLGSGIRFNDGQIDRQGRFWVSTMIEDESLPASSAMLISIDKNWKIANHLSNFKVGNSLAWEKQSKTFYFSDSSEQQIWSFKFDPIKGSISEQKTFAHLKQAQYPDGAEVDSHNNLWCANWGGSSLSVYSANGSEILNLPLPVSQPTCLTFGGPKLDHLIVTSASYNKSEQDLKKEPSAGNLLVYKTEFVGLQTNIWGSINHV